MDWYILLAVQVNAKQREKGAKAQGKAKQLVDCIRVAARANALLFNSSCLIASLPGFSLFSQQIIVRLERND
jgi:hypothetical protein